MPQLREYFSRQPVDRAWLFGSCSRGEENIDSDVDILVRYKDKEYVSLFTISRMMCDLRKIFNRPVDLVEEDGLMPFATNSVQRDKILIYERAN